MSDPITPTQDHKDTRILGGSMSAWTDKMHARENREYAACVECGWAFGWQGPTDPPGAQRVHEHAMRAALEAAHTPKENDA